MKNKYTKMHLFNVKYAINTFIYLCNTLQLYFWFIKLVNLKFTRFEQFIFCFLQNNDIYEELIILHVLLLFSMLKAVVLHNICCGNRDMFKRIHNNTMYLTEKLFTVTFGEFNVFLLNKSINLFQKSSV